MSHTQDFLLNKKVKILQPNNGYRASIDAVVLASMVKNIKNNQKVLDVGSGTGAVSLCIAQRFNDKNIEIHGLEIQEKLSDLSNQSAKLNNFDNLLYHNVNIKNKMTEISPNSFDHVVSNPPYASNDFASPNPSKARAHNESELDLNEWVKFCLKMLKQKGMFYMINRVERLDDIIKACYGKVGAIEIIPIFSKPDDVEAKRVIVIAQKAMKTPLKINKGFYMHEKDLSYSKKANDILVNAKSYWD